MDSNIDDALKIIFTQLNSNKFKQLIKYLCTQNKFVRLEFNKLGIKFLLMNRDKSQIFCLELESKYFNLYFCLQNIDIIVTLHTLNLYLNNLDENDYLELSLPSLSDQNLKINILNFNFKIKKSLQLERINNIDIENIFIMPFRFENVYSINTIYLKNLINLLNYISSPKNITIGYSNNNITFDISGNFEYEYRLLIKNYLSIFPNSYYRLRCTYQNFDIFVKMIIRKKCNKDYINNISNELWNMILQFIYKPLDLDSIKFIIESKSNDDSTNLDDYQSLATFDSEKLKGIIDLSYSLDSTHLLNLYLQENYPLVLDHNIIQFGSFKSITTFL